MEKYQEKPTVETSADTGESAAPEKKPAVRNLAQRTVAALSPIGRAEAAPVATRKAAESTAGERWAIQLGAFSQQAAAEKTAHTALAKLPMAKGKPLQILAPEKTDKERLYRVRLVDFTRHEADQACSVLHRKHQICALVAPVTTRVARS